MNEVAQMTEKSERERERDRENETKRVLDL